MWSKKHDSCIECGTTKVRHQGGGLCRNCYTRKWRREHPESVKITREKYRSNPENQAKEKVYAQSEHGRRLGREKSKRYKERHPERVKEIQKNWYERNKERVKEYQQRPDVKLRNRRSVLIRKYGPNALVALDRDKNECQKCEKIDPQVHHIDWNHSNDGLDNMIILCNSCHKSLHAWLPRWLRRFVFELWMNDEDDGVPTERVKERLRLLLDSL